MIKQSTNIDIKNMTTFGIPAECGCLFEYDTENDLKELFSKGALSKGFFCLGGGSNLLFTTGRFNATVIHQTEPKKPCSLIAEDGDIKFIEAPAGATLNRVCVDIACRGLWGCENLSGIPGTVGGAVVQNAGAYGAEMKDVVKTVRCFDAETGDFVEFDRDDCDFGYRYSIFKQPDFQKRYIIVSVIMKLTASYSPNLKYAALEKMFAGNEYGSLDPFRISEEVIALRDSKLPNPAKTGSAGSFFRNPVVDERQLIDVKESWDRMRAESGLEPESFPIFPAENGGFKLSAAWLIDRSGCKKLKSGGAGVWQKQPLVIVNETGEALGQDIVNLEGMIKQSVMNTFGVELQPEVIHI